jgi:hypothetical protein
MYVCAVGEAIGRLLDKKLVDAVCVIGGRHGPDLTFAKEKELYKNRSCYTIVRLRLFGTSEIG